MGEILKHVGNMLIIDLMITASTRKCNCCIIREILQCKNTQLSLGTHCRSTWLHRTNWCGFILCAMESHFRKPYPGVNSQTPEVRPPYLHPVWFSALSGWVCTPLLKNVHTLPQCSFCISTKGWGCPGNIWSGQGQDEKVTKCKREDADVCNCITVIITITAITTF